MMQVLLTPNLQQCIANMEVHTNLPKVSDKVTARRLNLAGHCLQHLGYLHGWHTKEGHWQDKYRQAEDPDAGSR